MVNFGQLGKALDAAKSLAGQHSDKIGDAIDKSVEAVDKATGGKHSDKINQGAEKLKGAADQFAGDTAARPRDPETGAPPASAQEAPVSDPGSRGQAADAPVPDPESPVVDSDAVVDPGTTGRAADAPVVDPDAPKGAS